MRYLVNQTQLNRWRHERVKMESKEMKTTESTLKRMARWMGKMELYRVLRLMRKMVMEQMIRNLRRKF